MDVELSDVELVDVELPDVKLLDVELVDAEYSACDNSELSLDDNSLMLSRKSRSTGTIE